MLTRLESGVSSWFLFTTLDDANDARITFTKLARLLQRHQGKYIAYAVNASHMLRCMMVHTYYLSVKLH